MTSRPEEADRTFPAGIAARLRREILTGELPPGSPLKERDNAQRLGVSRTPLREAVRILGQEGLVTLRPLRSPVVADPSLAEVLDEIAVLRQLEIFSGVLACVNATPQGLARVQESIEAMRADIAHGRDVMEHDREFHIRIAEMSGNSVLTTLVATLFDERRGPLANHMRIRLESQPTWHAALAEHELIFKCLQSRDPLAAESAIRAHIRAAADRWELPL